MSRTFAVILVLCLSATVQAQRKKSKMLPDYSNHPCIRPCEEDTEPMDCRYHFVLESYQTMAKACYDCAKGNVTDCRRDHCVTANGFSRNIKTVNRGIPGPTIQVCEGDTVILDVDNFFSMAEGTSIHWHGILQRFHPYMDGVSMITQCPVPAYTTFQYRFVVDDEGTHFWHSHAGLQRAEGIFGSFVVRQRPSRDPHSGSYDFDLPEHVIIVNEWQNKPVVDVYTAYQHADGEEIADAILINGRASDSTETLKLPRSVFRVDPGKRYRFRIISAGSLFCPIRVSIDNHNLTLIASDGRPFDAFEVESFEVYSAERYDFILTADQKPGNYWLRAVGLGSCTDLEERAVLRYVSPDVKDDDVTDSQLSAPPRPELTRTSFNAIQVDGTEPLGDTRDLILAMNATVPDDRALTGTPDHQFLLMFENRVVDNLHYYDPDLYPAGVGPYPPRPTAQINRISHKLGPVPILGQMDEIPENELCNVTSEGERCQEEWCECVHVLRVRKGDLVEMVLISPTGSGFLHPIHLHGHSFRVVAMERVDQVLSAELFRDMDARGDIKRKLSRAPLKDTVALPNDGYVIIRFVADNPGAWFLHCHLAFHAEIGMGLALVVVDKNGKLPKRPAQFPKCGHFEVSPDEERDGLLAGKHQHTQPEQNPSLQKSSGQSSDTNDIFEVERDGPTTSAALPSWVVPVVVSMTIAIVGLLVVSVRLWRRTRRLARRQEGLTPTSAPYHDHYPHTPPSLGDAGERTLRDELSYGSVGGEPFSYSRAQERASLVHNSA